MKNVEKCSIAGKFQTLKISEVFIPQEMKNLYDYTNREIEIETIKTSIEEFGQLQPVLCVKENDKLFIINGVLRFEALIRLEKNEIDVILVDFNFEEESFSLEDLIIHSQIQKVKTAKEKLREFISILRIESGDSNPLRDRNQRYNFLSDSLGKGWSRSNVILMMNVIKWTMDNGDGLNIVDQVFEEKILVSQAAFVVESLAREDYNYEKEGESKILAKYLQGAFNKDKALSLIDTFNYKRNEGYTEIDIYPIKSENYEIIHGSIEDVELSEDMEIDVVFSSPIYYKLRRYGDDPNEMGWEATPKLYAKRLVDTLMKPYARLKESGSMFINLGETYDKGQCLAVIEHVVLEMVERGMFYVDRVIWKKDSNKPISNQNHRFQPSYEVVLHFAKSKNFYFNRFKIKKDITNFNIARGCKDYGWDGVNYYVPNFYKQLRNILSENELHDIVTVQTNSSRIKHIEGEEWHPATFSQMLPAIFLSTFCPKPTKDYTPLVFDPYSGIASTGSTSLMMGYRYCGVELYQNNVNTSKRVLAESLSEYHPLALEYLESQKEYELVA
ncbi:DNA methyltransferase [Aquirufa lenticrescens]|uniref:DNA methyltransferase n=1 Tax=Aquirufa lenticrescens TaxID=2696560 RepID=UPI001CAA5EE1|nr:DNA methyltransferase [Aquirufa lenticrescens]UAJ13621.1 ParB N-terminal domain-containing protein [Aquirufa lenticrescens]